MISMPEQINSENQELEVWIIHSDLYPSIVFSNSVLPEKLRIRVYGAGVVLGGRGINGENSPSFLRGEEGRERRMGINPCLSSFLTHPNIEINLPFPFLSSIPTLIEDNL